MLNNVKAIVDVADLTVQKYGTRDELFYCDYGSNVNIEGTSEELTIRGGQNSPIRIVAHHSQDASFSSEMPLVDIGALGAKVGREVEVGATVAPQTDRKVVSSATIELSQTPETGTLKIYQLDTNGRDKTIELVEGDPATNDDEYSITGTTVTVSSTIADGTEIRAHYDYTAGVNTKKLRMTTEDIAGAVRITGSGYGIDENDNKAPIKFIIHRMKPSPDFAINFAAGEATNIPFNGRILPELVNVDGKTVNEFWSYIELTDETL